MPYYPVVTHRVPQLLQIIDTLRTCSFEHCMGVALNQQNVVVSTMRFSSLDSKEVVINPRLLVCSCLTDTATQLILTHNHPSGSAFPSRADLRTTDRLQYILDAFNILITDHIIVTENSYFSFAEAGLLSQVKNRTV